MNHPHACRHCSRPWSRETFRWGIIFFATMLLCSCQAPSVRTTITDDGLSVESLARIAAPAANPSGAILRADDEPTAYPETASTANYQVVVGDIASNADRTIPPRGKFLTRPNEIDLVGFDGDPLAEACGACDADGAPCPWRPPGIKGPWPRDEYLCDGGDDHLPARVDQQWNASGIDLEDTVGHYDTLGGSVEVVASNRVCIYAPRFAAVRKVSGAGVASALDIATPIRTGEPVGEFAESTIADGVKQPIATVRQIGTYAAQAVEDQQKGLLVDNRIVPHENREALLPYEDFQVVSTGLFDTNDKPRLATSVDSALTWSLNQAVQLVVDGQLPLTVEADGTPQTFVQYELQDRG
ncbi:MAG: hypothetical protein KDA99_22090, partial [Planctomycetales bacterium]|nr:hypothetical protein [Planctomycetales bacterium]